VDAAGGTYVTGWTYSPDFPTAAPPGNSPFQAAPGGGSTDAFVASVNATGSALAYATYLGGSSDDNGHAIAVDAAGSAYVTGYTESSDFPTAAPPGQSPFQAAPGGEYDAFVA
jgi:hypothetical protein